MWRYINRLLNRTDDTSPKLLDESTRLLPLQVKSAEQSVQVKSVAQREPEALSHYDVEMTEIIPKTQSKSGLVSYANTALSYDVFQEILSYQYWEDRITTCICFQRYDEKLLSDFDGFNALENHQRYFTENPNYTEHSFFEKFSRNFFIPVVRNPLLDQREEIISAQKKLCLPYDWCPIAQSVHIYHKAAVRRSLFEKVLISVKESYKQNGYIPNTRLFWMLLYATIFLTSAVVSLYFFITRLRMKEFFMTADGHIALTTSAPVISGDDRVRYFSGLQCASPCDNFQPENKSFVCQFYDGPGYLDSEIILNMLLGLFDIENSSWSVVYERAVETSRMLINNMSRTCISIQNKPDLCLNGFNQNLFSHYVTSASNENGGATIVGVDMKVACTAFIAPLYTLLVITGIVASLSLVFLAIQVYLRNINCGTQAESLVADFDSAKLLYSLIRFDFGRKKQATQTKQSTENNAHRELGA